MPASSPAMSLRSSPRPSRQFRYRHRSRHDAVGNSDAYDNGTSHVHPPIAAAIRGLQALQAEGTGSRDVNPLHYAHMQEMRISGRHRTQEEIQHDTAMRQSRAANEYLARLGLPTSRIEPHDLPGLQTRLQGFTFDTLYGQAQTITTSLGNVAQRRCMQRQGTSLKVVPLLDFEIDALNNPPPQYNGGERAISV